MPRDYSVIFHGLIGRLRRFLPLATEVPQNRLLPGSRYEGCKDSGIVKDGDTIRLTPNTHPNTHSLTTEWIRLMKTFRFSMWLTSIVSVALWTVIGCSQSSSNS